MLAAQLLFDVLGDQALEMHGDISLVPHAAPGALETQLKEAHAATGWNNVQQQFGLTGKGQTVAVIDSGIAWDHVALGRGLGPGYRVVGGWDFTEENDANPYDDGPLGFHGTHVAGIIGSSHGQHSGVAPQVDMVALRVFNDLGQGQLSWVERALQWVHEHRHAFENPITTVNLSLGTTWNGNEVPAWATLEEELRTLYQDGIVVIASAGNSFQQYLTSGLSYPAASPYVLPVASVDDDGRLSDFSQRNDQVLAAPGRNIVSSVPDHVLGRDGKVDDFTPASGTSMAAPYVAGASVLVRQAMQMVDYADINLTSIANHLRSTADTVYDAITGASYHRLNLQQAIDTLIPDDQVGNSFPQATPIDLSTGGVEGWLNTLDDRDVYRFTPAHSGTLQLEARSDWLERLSWSVHTSSGTSLASGGAGAGSLALVAGQTYLLSVSSQTEIGSFQLDLDFKPHSDSPSGSGPPAGEPSGEGGSPPAAPVNLGAVHYLDQSWEAGKSLRVQASQNGTFSVQWSNPDAPHGQLWVRTAGGISTSDASWSQGELRLDMEVTAGQWLDVQLPGGAGDQGQLVLANALFRSGGELRLTGGLGADELTLDIRDGLKLRLGDIQYAFPTGSINQLTIDAHMGNDQLNIIGSSQADKLDLRPGGSTLENNHIQVDIQHVEQIHYHSGGGPDRVYVYDSDGDDILTARPRSAELVGVGYKFSVENVDRIFVHATGSGQDYAYLYDSPGDDRLSVRPQFSSLTGEGYFNYVRGFERVYAYASAGVDSAALYDSAGDDRFTTSGASASIVGPGFSSFTRAFENVQAYSDAGGRDWATLYGSDQHTRWEQASDYISFRESGLTREARGFARVDTFVDNLPRGPSSLADSPAMPLSPDQPAASELLSSEPVGDVRFPSELTSDVGLPPLPANLAGLVATATTIFAEPGSLLPLAGHDGPSAFSDQLAQQQLLDEVQAMADWLRDEAELSPAGLWDDPEAELNLLDEIFSRHAQANPPSGRVR